MDVGRGVRHHSFEERCLAAVAAEVAAVEEAIASRLNQEGVRIERRVIDEVGRDLERADGNRLARLVTPAGGRDRPCPWQERRSRS